MIALLLLTTPLAGNPQDALSQAGRATAVLGKRS
jgi:hypothetical protein